MISRVIKITLLLLGLTVFVLPKQMVFAQITMECCDQISTENCCTKKADTCHTDKKDSKPEKNDCENECPKCHSCTANFNFAFALNSEPSVTESFPFENSAVFNYKEPFTSSTIQNIWQPPKIG